MKRIVILVVCMLFILSGCGIENSTTPTIPPVVADHSSDPLPANFSSDTDLSAVSVPATTEKYVLEDGTEIFSYTTQRMELILSNEAVADKIILNFQNRFEDDRTSTETSLAAAQADYSTSEDFYPYFHHRIYSPKRIDHSVLSLFGTKNSYTGGLHGSLRCVAANYDLQTGDVLTLGSIMHADASVEDFARLIVDKLMPRQDELYLYEDYAETIHNRLYSDENLYEDFYFTPSGLTFFFSPYEIAPYSSGIITVELPYAELSELVYGDYLPPERAEMTGAMKTGSFMELDMEQFTNMAEVTLTAGEEIMVAYPVGSVEDIRVQIAGDGMNIPDYTVFAAFEMSDQDAVVISLSQEEIQRIQITYFDGSKVQHIPLS